MRLVPRPSRFLTVLLALVQLALPGALGVVHAMGVRAAGPTVVHVEAKSGPHCQPPHGDECVVCRHLSTGATKVDSLSSLVPELVRESSATRVEPAPHAATGHRLQSRAPPVSLS